MFDNNNVTCISPWHEIRINTDGSLTYCHFSKDLTSSPDIKFIEWFKSGQQVVAARHNIQQGKEVTGCANCYKEDKLGMVTHRNRRNLQAAIYPGWEKLSLEQSPTFQRLKKIEVEQKPSFIHVSLGNLCNLSCRMCRPLYSSNLSRTLTKAGISGEKEIYDWTDNSELWQDFLYNLVIKNPSLLCLHFMGGEPLYHKKFYQVLDTCIKHKKTDFHLTFVSNGTIYSGELIDKLKYFKSVQIEISVENFHKSNDYTRIGSNFNEIKQNIIKFNSNQHSNISVILRTVYQALTAGDYTSILNFAIDQNLNIDNNVLHDPKFLSAVILPKRYKENLYHNISNYEKYIQDKYNVKEDNFLNSLRNRSEVVKDCMRIVHDIKKLLNVAEPDNIEELRRQFVSYNKKIDAVTENNFLNVYPELEEFYVQYS